MLFGHSHIMTDQLYRKHPDPPRRPRACFPQDLGAGPREAFCQPLPAKSNDGTPLYSSSIVSITRGLRLPDTPIGFATSKKPRWRKPEGVADRIPLTPKPLYTTTTTPNQPPRKGSKPRAG